MLLEKQSRYICSVASRQQSADKLWNPFVLDMLVSGVQGLEVLLMRSAPRYESQQIVPFTLENLLLRQEKAAWKPVPLLPHADVDRPPLRHSVNTWVSGDPVKFWVQVQGPMVACGRQKVIRLKK